MMDPISVASLGLGAASLAIQIFDGVKSGYEYFEYAANMPEDCASFKLRLRIEYTKLLDWADVAGLTGKEEEHRKFDQKYKANRAIILAVLSEMNALFQSLQRNYKELEIHADELHSNGNEQQTSGKEKDNLPAGADDIKIEITFDPQEVKKTPKQKQIYKGEVNDIDLGAYSMFQTPSLPRKPQRGYKGLNHLFNLTKKVKTMMMKPNSLKWGMIDRNKYYKALGKLTQLNEYLHQTLGDYQLEALAQSTREICLAMLCLTKSAQEMRDLLEAAKIVRIPDLMQNDSTVSFQATSPADSSDEYRGCGTLFERLTHFSIVHDEIDNESNMDSRLGTRLDWQENFRIVCEAEKDRGSRSLAKFHKKNVWVEWKKYKEVPIQPEGGQRVWDVSPSLAERLGQLAALLERKDKPEEFHIPHCLGYFQDKENFRFGFVFEVSGQGQQNVQPISLFELLYKEAPTINERVKIAQDLAVSLFCLHAASWLHKGLRSASVIFCTTDEQINISEPLISGFEYARPNVKDVTTTKPPNDPTWAVYCHPAYQGKNPERFRKAFDIYSLGIILLEIAHWKPAERLLHLEKIDQSSRDAALKEVQFQIIEGDSQLLESVKSTMGQCYYSAVKVCVEGLEDFEIGQAEELAEAEKNALIQQAYLRRVIDVLQGINV